MIPPALASALAQLDDEGLEGWRGRLDPAWIPALIDRYFQAEEDWTLRVRLAALLQDQHHPGLAAVWRDVLRAPPVDDLTELTQAAALAVSGDDRFSLFVRDRAALRRAVLAALAAAGLSPAPLPVAQPAPVTPEADGFWAALAADDPVALRRHLPPGASPNTKRDGDPPLLRALIDDRFRVAHALLDAGADPNLRRDTADQTALGWAAFKRREDLVERLLALGAEADAVDRWGYSPLVKAVGEGSAAITRRLLAAGADPKRVTYDSRTVMSFAIRGSDPATIALLLDAGVDVNARCGIFYPLAFAAFESTAAVAKLLLDRGAEPNARVSYQGYHACTALHFAAQRGQLGLVQALLAGGARPDLVDRFGKRPADFLPPRASARLTALLNP